MMNLQIMLMKISEISKKYEQLNKDNGRYFNIFDIVNKATDEVTICRVLAELLSPIGSHHQCDTYLKLFFASVLHLPITDTELKTAKVYREYSIDDSRRIDLVIETQNRFIPIEVKIYAGEQENQCFDYYKKAKGSKLYYLTRLGNSPSEWSAKGLTAIKIGDGEYVYDEVVNISFADNILTWLDLCIKESVRIPPIREIILQLISVVQNFTGQMEDEKEMEIKELLLSDPRNMKSAMEMQNVLEELKVDMLKNVFDAIEKKVIQTAKGNGLLENKTQKLNNEYDYSERNFEKLRTYYLRKGFTWPGISYLHKAAVKQDVDIWVRIEIEDEIFIGYCCPVNNKGGKQVLSKEEIRQHLAVEPNIEDWWAVWELCPTDGSCPNFKSFNNAYYDLFDKDKFDSFVAYCADKICFLLSR